LQQVSYGGSPQQAPVDTKPLLPPSQNYTPYQTMGGSPRYPSMDSHPHHSPMPMQQQQQQQQMPPQLPSQPNPVSQGQTINFTQQHLRMSTAAVSSSNNITATPTNNPNSLNNGNANSILSNYPHPPNTMNPNSSMPEKSTKGGGPIMGSNGINGPTPHDIRMQQQQSLFRQQQQQQQYMSNHARGMGPMTSRQPIPPNVTQRFPMTDATNRFMGPGNRPGGGMPVNQQQMYSGGAMSNNNGSPDFRQMPYRQQVSGPAGLQQQHNQQPTRPPSSGNNGVVGHMMNSSFSTNGVDSGMKTQLGRGDVAAPPQQWLSPHQQRDLNCRPPHHNGNGMQQHSQPPSFQHSSYARGMRFWDVIPVFIIF